MVFNVDMQGPKFQTENFMMFGSLMPLFYSLSLLSKTALGTATL
jgi:hypothetical protein